MNDANFFVSSAGELLRNDATCAVVRENFARHHRAITSGLELRATLRAGPYAWPGGYDVFAITSDGAPLCFSCVRDNLALVLGAIRTGADDGWRIVATECAANTDCPTCCDHCGAVLVSDNDDDDN